jgi:hypothetical protein
MVWGLGFGVQSFGVYILGFTHSGIALGVGMLI